jgi:hypothetical protein
MLVIDKEKDCVVLGRQSRFVPRMWSCLAGFIEVKCASMVSILHAHVVNFYVRRDKLRMDS